MESEVKRYCVCLCACALYTRRRVLVWVNSSTRSRRAWRGERASDEKERSQSRGALAKPISQCSAAKSSPVMPYNIYFSFHYSALSPSLSFSLVGNALSVFVARYRLLRAHIQSPSLSLCLSLSFSRFASTRPPTYIPIYTAPQSGLLG